MPQGVDHNVEDDGDNDDAQQREGKRQTMTTAANGKRRWRQANHVIGLKTLCTSVCFCLLFVFGSPACAANLLLLQLLPNAPKLKTKLKAREARTSHKSCQKAGRAGRQRQRQRAAARE